MNNANLIVAVGLVAGMVIMLCVVVHRQQQQIDDMQTLVHVAEAAIGSNAAATFNRVAEKLELEMRTHPDGSRPEYPVP